MSLVTYWREKFSRQIFNWIHYHNLVYNTCWEDPALDREALNFNSKDKVLVISSAGCNALDYLLTGVHEVHAVDINPIQNALLELKKAAILNLDYDHFFHLFGEGRHPAAKEIYAKALRKDLSKFSREYWDRKIVYFCGQGWRDSFYYRGTSGLLAKFVSIYLYIFRRLREPLEEVLSAQNLEEQRQVYERKIKPHLWSRCLKWALNQNLTHAMVGIPLSQRSQIELHYPGGIDKYCEDWIENVITRIPIQNNYFYRVYLQGKYTKTCCPEYLKEQNFKMLKNKVHDLYINTSSLTDYMKASQAQFSKFVLLDHMDWMGAHDPQALAEEWSLILNKSTPYARAIFRSAAPKITYLDSLRVNYKGHDVELGNLLKYEETLATKLHAMDRVHSYASFYIVNLPT